MSIEKPNEPSAETLKAEALSLTEQAVKRYMQVGALARGIDDAMSKDAYENVLKLDPNNEEAKKILEEWK